MKDGFRISSLKEHIKHRADGSSSRDGSPPLDTKIASLIFSAKRADYYRFLADMMEGTKGRVSIRDIFLGDARRYGTTARGKLSLYWARRFDEGGSLLRTFKGTLPAHEIAILDTLQKQSGEGALEDGLRDLASNTALVNSARTTLLTTMAASLVCISLVLAMVIAMPSFTVPQLVNAFNMLPADYMPNSANSLISFADYVSANWLMITLTIIGFIAACFWSMSNLTGHVRLFLDKYFIIWGIHRDFESVRFLSNLAAVLRKRGNKTIGLREAIAMQMAGASRWRSHHIHRMLEIIDGGETGAPVFNTGMLDQETAWYISDLISSRGLEDALQFVKERLETRVLARIKVQSSVLSWVLMIVAITISAYLMFWHVVAIDDMRIALQQYLS